METLVSILGHFGNLGFHKEGEWRGSGGGAEGERRGSGGGAEGVRRGAEGVTPPIVAQICILRNHGCSKCIFAQSWLHKMQICAITKGFKTHLPFEGVPKYWIYSKTSVKRLEEVQNYLLCVNLKQIIYKRFLVFFQQKNRHKDVLKKTC